MKYERGSEYGKAYWKGNLRYNLWLGQISRSCVVHRVYTARTTSYEDSSTLVRTSITNNLKSTSTWKKGGVQCHT